MNFDVIINKGCLCAKVIALKTKLILRLSRKKLRWDFHIEIWAIKQVDKRHEINKKRKQIYLTS